MDEERAIREFMGDRPRSEELVNWAAALRARLAKLKEAAKRAEAEGSSAPAPQNELARLQQQIAALEQEAAITQFVEDSVRVTLAMGAVAEGAGEDDYS
jgi:hypothetical protein